MATKPSKLRSGKPLTRFGALKTRFGAFFVDWALWGYVAYAVVYLLNRYWYTEIYFYGRLTVPTWGWPIVILGTLELAVISHAFAQSIGLSAFGLRVLTQDYQYPSRAARLRRYLWWHVSLLSLPITLFGSGLKNQLLHDRMSKTGMFRIKDVKDEMPLARPRAWYKTNRGVVAVLLIALTIWVGGLVTQINISALIDRAPKTAYMWKALVTPDFTHLFALDPELAVNANPDLPASIFSGLLQSLFMALLATVLGGMIAFPLSFLGARNMMGFSSLGWAIYWVMRGFFNIVRSIESLLWGIVFAIWVGFGPFAGVLALSVHTIAALGKLYSEQVEGIDPGPLEAMASSGARRWQVIMYGVIPQVVPSFLAFTLYRWDINLRMATVISLVGGGGIGRLLFYYKGQVGRIPNAWNQVAAVIAVIVVVVWLLDYLSGRVREKIN